MVGAGDDDAAVSRRIVTSRVFARRQRPCQRGRHQHADQEKDQRMWKANQRAFRVDRALLGGFGLGVVSASFAGLTVLRQTFGPPTEAILSLGVLLRLAVLLLPALLEIVVRFSGQRR
jgi:hypothetical protein